MKTSQIQSEWPLWICWKRWWRGVEAKTTRHGGICNRACIFSFSAKYKYSHICEWRSCCCTCDRGSWGALLFFVIFFFFLIFLRDTLSASGDKGQLMPLTISTNILPADIRSISVHVTDGYKVIIQPKVYSYYTGGTFKSRGQIPSNQTVELLGYGGSIWTDTDKLQAVTH